MHIINGLKENNYIKLLLNSSRYILCMKGQCRCKNNYRVNGVFMDSSANESQYINGATSAYSMLFYFQTCKFVSKLKPNIIQ